MDVLDFFAAQARDGDVIALHAGGKHNQLEHGRRGSSAGAAGRAAGGGAPTVTEPGRVTHGDALTRDVISSRGQADAFFEDKAAGRPGSARAYGYGQGGPARVANVSATATRALKAEGKSNASVERANSRLQRRSTETPPQSFNPQVHQRFIRSFDSDLGTVLGAVRNNLQPEGPS